MTGSENQIAVHWPNGTVRLDVRLENEMVWPSKLRGLICAIRAGGDMK